MDKRLPFLLVLVALTALLAFAPLGSGASSSRQTVREAAAQPTVRGPRGPRGFRGRRGPERLPRAPWAAGRRRPAGASGRGGPRGSGRTDRLPRPAWYPRRDGPAGRAGHRPRETGAHVLNGRRFGRPSRRGRDRRRRARPDHVRRRQRARRRPLLGPRLHDLDDLDDRHVLAVPAVHLGRGRRGRARPDLVRELLGRAPQGRALLEHGVHRGDALDSRRSREQRVRDDLGRDRLRRARRDRLPRAEGPRAQGRPLREPRVHERHDLVDRSAGRHLPGRDLGRDRPGRAPADQLRDLRPQGRPLLRRCVHLGDHRHARQR